MLTHDASSKECTVLDEKTDLVHAEIVALFLNTVDSTEYNNPEFILKLRSRALEGVRDIVVMVTSDALLTEDTQRPFNLYHEFAHITMNSKKNSKGIYAKASGSNQDVGLNALEYAIITGSGNLVTSLIHLGVVSKNLDKLEANLNLIYSEINQKYSKEIIKLWKINAHKVKPENLQILAVKNKDHLTALLILLQNHKKAFALQLSIALIGLACILVAVFTLESAGPAYGICMAIGGALISSALVNTGASLMNAAREDALNSMRLHKQTLNTLASFVDSLRLTVDGALSTMVLAKDGSNTQTYSEPQTPRLMIQPKAQPSEPATQPSAMIFSRDNLPPGLGTNSYDTSTQNLPEIFKARRWESMV